VGTGAAIRWLGRASSIQQGLRRRSQASTPGRERRRFFEVAKDFVPYLVAEREGQLFLVATDDPTHRNFFLRDRSKEGVVLKRALRSLEAAGTPVSRKTFIDIGANTGTTTLAALSAGFRSVVACEPGPTSFKLLRANLVLNDVEHSVRAVQVALSDQSGVGTLDVKSRSRKARLLANPDDVARKRHHQVRITTLDQLIAEIRLDPKEVGLIFIDVEGHECHVLEGASRLLEEGIPTIMELHPKLLRLANRLDDFAGLIPRHYTHILDLRGKSARSFQSVENIGILINELGDGATDILACRFERGDESRPL
jgi:FkbM family methyltransferase